MPGYICCAFLICCVGIYFMAANLFSGYPSFAYALNSSLFIFMLNHPDFDYALHGGGSAQQDRPAAADQSGQRRQNGAGQVLRHAYGTGAPLPAVLPVPAHHQTERHRYAGGGLCHPAHVLPAGQRVHRRRPAGIVSDREPGHRGHRYLRCRAVPAAVELVGRLHPPLPRHLWWAFCCWPCCWAWSSTH